MRIDLPNSRVALFVPCYIDQLYPDVAWASLDLLEAHGVRAEVPAAQTCCGQPLINTGAVDAARPLGELFASTFRDYDYVVCPSGSCTATLHRQARWLAAETRCNLEEPRTASSNTEAVPNAQIVLARPPGSSPRVLELCQFLVEVVGVQSVNVDFPHRVILHESCHGLRDLGLGRPSELGPGPARTNPGRQLLASVRGLTLLAPSRADECCGFGGSFCIVEPAVSASMGTDRLDDFAGAGAEIVTSGDMSCLMHLSGLSQRQSRPLGVMHIAQILAGRAVPSSGTTRPGANIPSGGVS